MISMDCSQMDTQEGLRKHCKDCTVVSMLRARTILLTLYGYCNTLAKVLCCDKC